MVDDYAIAEAVDLAPQTTRARLRGEFIRRPRSASATTRWTGCT
ncbi:MAG: proteasome accessory factor PafA2 family protein [Microthrixaceae bacterium]